jgi:Putative zinc ribbon domain
MQAQESKGPFCQSCAMPLQRPEDLGTATGGGRSEEYCRYCFVDGAFTAPDITLPAMIDLCTGILVQRGMLKDQAHTLMSDTLPTLRRWQRAAAP